MIFPCVTFSLEEVNLHLNDDDRLPFKLKTHAEYFANVYNGKIEDAPAALKIFSESGLKIENSIVESVKLHVLYSQVLSDEVKKGKNNTFTSDTEALEPGVRVKFNDDKTEFAFDYNIMRNIDGYDNHVTEKISLLCLSHKLTDNQKILFGQGARLPYSVSSSEGLAELDTVKRGQFGRTAGNVRSVGIRNVADYKYLDYDIGVYDSARYFNEFGRGADFSGHVNIKPFSFNDESKTNFTFGAGYNAGKHHTSYQIHSFYAGYDYKKFHVYSEYESADGYNGKQNSSDKAEGFYTTLRYDISPKFSIVGKYDMFIPDKNSSNKYSSEYTVGINRKLFKNMRLMLNYVKRINSKGADSDIILFATRFIL